MKYHGMCKENAPKFQKTKVVEIMMAIDPDIGRDDLKVPPDTPGAADSDYVAVEPDVEDVADFSSLPFSDVAKELIHDGRATPTGWRRDDFPPGGALVRCTVWAPPWTPRPPNIEAEAWLSQNKKHQNSRREAWKLRDPAGFEAQEERRRRYLLMKKNGTVMSKAAIALPALACKWFLETENEWFNDDRYDTTDPTIS